MYMYLVSYEDGFSPKKLFKKESNAVDSIPESRRYYPCQVSGKLWSYGTRKGSKVFIERIVVADENDLRP